MNKKLFAPIFSIAALAAVSIGATYALFTDKKEANVDITAGKVKVALSGEVTEAESRYLDDNPYNALISSTSAIYENGNTASLEVGDDGNLTLELDRMTPMDDITVGLTIENASNVDMKWRLVIDLTDDLIPALEIKIDDNDYSSAIVPAQIVTSWSEVVHPSETDLEDSDLYIAFPDHDSIDPNFDNQYQGKTGHIKISVEAVQGNAATEDPHEIKYGIYDSVLVDEGLETEHWVHQISNVAEFRNIVTNEGNTATPGVMYPGAGEATTVYLIRNNIDFGGNAIWTSDDPIEDFVFSGSLEGANSSITLSGYHLDSGLGTTSTMGMFRYARAATFKNLVLDDFVFEYDSGAECGFFAAMTESNDYDAARVLRFENILIEDSCSITASKSIGALMGLARGCFDLEAKNVVNNAEIIGGVNNLGGFISQASAGSVPSGATGTWRFENCINNGNITHTGGGNIAGFVNQLHGKISVIIKDCECIYSYRYRIHHKGKIIENPCARCHGQGHINVRTKVDVDVPAGIDDRQVFTVSGAGNEGSNGGPKGNLKVVVIVKEHELFKRDGYNVFVESHVSFTQAALGDTLRIPTLWGDIKMDIPSGTQSGTVFKLRSKGVPVPGTRNNGDQHVTIIVDVPKSLTQKQKEIIVQLENELGVTRGAPVSQSKKGIFDK